MIDPELGNFGKEGVEEGMGYAPMTPLDKTEDGAPTYDSGDHGADLQGAAKELQDRRDQQIREAQGRPVDAVREYQQAVGADAGKPMPSNQTVSPEQARTT